MIWKYLGISGAARFSYETEQVVRARVGSRDMPCVTVRPNSHAVPGHPMSVQ